MVSGCPSRLPTFCCDLSICTNLVDTQAFSGNIHQKSARFGASKQRNAPGKAARRGRSEGGVLRQLASGRTLRTNRDQPENSPIRISEKVGLGPGPFTSQ